MKKIKIGLPKGLNYYHDNVLWKNFFEKLGLEVIISTPTNKATIINGSKYMVDEACLSVKVFMGHVDYLKDKCDYILVPRLNCIKKKQKLCTNFAAIYDICKNVFKEVNFLNYNIDLDKKDTEEKAFIKLGESLGFNKKEIIKAYRYAKQKEKKFYEEKKSDFKRKLKSDKEKILIVGHSYNINDNYIGKNIVNYLKNEDCIVLLSDIYNLDYDEAYANKISSKLYWTYNRKLLSIIGKYKNMVDGIILISTFPCGPDSLANELIIRRVKDIPLINLIIDDSSSDTGIITRLESFLDIIKSRKESDKNG